MLHEVTAMCIPSPLNRLKARLKSRAVYADAFARKLKVSYAGRSLAAALTSLTASFTRQARAELND